MGVTNILGKIGAIIGGKESSEAMRVDMNSCPAEYVKTIAFNSEFKALLSQDRFIARSDYQELISQYTEVFKFYDVLCRSGMLDAFVDKHNLDSPQTDYFSHYFRRD